MVSGSSAGIIEAWVDGTKIYTYTGNVNKGAVFADIYLQSDGAGTYFSNVLIFNYETDTPSQLLRMRKQNKTHTYLLTANKPSGKSLAIYHNNQTYYAPLKSTSNPTASAINLFSGGEILTLSEADSSKVYSVSINSPSVCAYQGETETATIIAVANEAVQSLAYELTGAPSWITNTDDIIYISPTDTDVLVKKNCNKKDYNKRF